MDSVVTRYEYRRIILPGYPYRDPGDELTELGREGWRVLWSEHLPTRSGEWRVYMLERRVTEMLGESGWIPVPLGWTQEGGDTT